MISVIAIALFPVLGALADGFQHKGEKLFGSYFKSAFIGVACSFLLFDHQLWHVLYLLLCWLLLFDVTYNIVRKLELFYVGKTKWTDRFLRWFCDTNQFTKTYYKHVSFMLKLGAAAGIFTLFYTGKL